MNILPKAKWIMLSAATIALLGLLIALILLAGASSKREASAQDVKELKHAVETYEKVMVRAALWPKEYRDKENLPDSLKKTQYEATLKTLSSILTSEFAKSEARAITDTIYYQDGEYFPDRYVEGDAKVVSWQGFTIDETDSTRATVIATVWKGSKKEHFNKVTGNIKATGALDYTIMERFRFQNVDGHWKLIAVPEYVKGSPLYDLVDPENNKYGPPTAEEADAAFSKVPPKPTGKPQLWLEN